MLRKLFVLGGCLTSLVGCHAAFAKRRIPHHQWDALVRGHPNRPSLESSIDQLIGALRKQLPNNQGNPWLVNGWNNSRIYAAQSLGDLGPAAARAVPYLVDCLDDPDKRVGQACMHALGRIGGAAVPALVEKLEDEKKAVRWRAAVGIAAVWSHGDPAHMRASMARPKISHAHTELAVEGLIDALFSVDTQLRCSAAFALGVIGPDAKAAAKNLAGVATDPDEKVAKQAIVALGRIGRAAQAESETVAGRLEVPGAELREQLVELHDPETAQRLRYYIAMSLVGMHSERSFWIPLTSGLVEGATHSRNAGRAEWHGYSVPGITKELRSSGDWKVRKAAAMALGEVGHSYPSGRQALEEARHDPDPRVREAVEEALRRNVSPGRAF